MFEQEENPVLRETVNLFTAVCLLMGLFGMQAARAQSFPPPGHALGSAPCIWAAPVQGKDQALDVAAVIHALQENRFDCVAQFIDSEPPHTWAEFQRLLSAAQPAGISVWAILIPPSEGATSLPYRTDYLGWMKELAKLSLQYPNLRGVSIDDLFSNISYQTFTPEYLRRLYKAKQEINPRLLFVPVIYELDAEVAERLAGCVDGVWLWWLNMEIVGGMRSHFENSRRVVQGRFPIYAGVYGHSTLFHPQGGPIPKVLRRSLEIACQYADGAVIFNLPLAPKSSDEATLLSTARTFAPGGSAELAGQCGLGSPRPRPRDEPQ
jgi:hypothetical protein